MHILPGLELIEASDTKSHSKHDKDNEFGQTQKSSFQNEQFTELKSSAGVGHNWNTLFVRPDAVANYLAAKFGLTMVMFYCILNILQQAILYYNLTIVLSNLFFKC